MTMFGELPPPNEELDQFFTEDDVARAFAVWSRVWQYNKVIEPSAGEGALLDQLYLDRQEVTAVELDPPYANYLQQVYGPKGVTVVEGNFLEADLSDDFELAFGNPPYNNGIDIDFLLKCLEHAPRVCFLMQTRVLHGKRRFRDLWSAVRLLRVGHFIHRPFPGAKGEYSAFEVTRSPQAGAPVGMPVEVTWIDTCGKCRA